jgi:hypothetical protein
MKGAIHNDFDRDRVVGIIRRLDLSKPYTVEIRLRKGRRTLDQNALLWLWLTCISQETGNDKDAMHEYFKQKFLQPTIVWINNEAVSHYSTKNLTTAQFKEYLDKIQVFASTELAITLPDPDDKIWEAFYEHYRDKL